MSHLRFSHSTNIQSHSQRSDCHNNTSWKI